MTNRVVFSSASFFRQAKIGDTVVARVTEADGVWYRQVGTGMAARDIACESFAAAELWFTAQLAAAMIAAGLEPV